MERLVLIRYGEIYLKGQNRPFFEKMLINNIKKAIQPFGQARFLKLKEGFI